MSTTSNAAVYLSTMSEADLMDGVAQAAKVYGWRVVHFRGGRRKGGFATAGRV